MAYKVARSRHGDLPQLQQLSANAAPAPQIAGMLTERVQTMPGIASAFTADGDNGVKRSLRPLFQWARLAIPQTAHSWTAVLLCATAGVRAMPEAEQKVLMNRARRALRKAGFEFVDSWAVVLTGPWEAALGWLALNSRHERLPAPDRPARDLPGLSNGPKRQLRGTLAHDKPHGTMHENDRQALAAHAELQDTNAFLSIAPTPWHDRTGTLHGQSAMRSLCSTAPLTGRPAESYDESSTLGLLDLGGSSIEMAAEDPAERVAGGQACSALFAGHGGDDGQCKVPLQTRQHGDSAGSVAIHLDVQGARCISIEIAVCRALHHSFMLLLPLCMTSALATRAFHEPW